jgi:hypothetical protein
VDGGRRSRRQELTCPEELRDFLEGAADREPGRVEAAVAEAVAGDLRDG